MSYLDLRDHHHNKFAQNLGELVHILQKPSSERSLQENRLIAIALEKIPFFANYARTSENSRERLANLSSVLNCEHYPALSVIHHHGDLAKKFMLILKGEARKYIPRDNEDIQNELNDINRILVNSPNNQTGLQVAAESNARNEKKTNATILIHNGSRSPTKILTSSTVKDIAHHTFGTIIKSPQNANSKDQPNQETGEEQPKNYHQSSPAEIEFFMELGMPKKYFVETALKFKRGKGPLSGDYFGEVGLAVNTLNDATLVAWEDVYVAVIEKKDYEQVFQELIQETRDKLDFITKNLLSGFTHKSSIPFSLNFQKMTYRSGEKIFQQGSSAKGFWVIKEGDVEVYRTVQYNNKTETNQPDESPSKKKSYKALIVRLSKGQLLGEETLVGMKERAFSAVGKSAKNIIYYFDEKAFEQADDTLQEVMNYVTGQAKISMEGKMQRLNSSLMEAHIVLSQSENFNLAEKHKLKDKIDDLLQGGKAVNQDPKKTQINSKKVARAGQSEQEAQEWNHYEKLAEVKQKVLMEKVKIDPKLLSDKAVDEELARKGYQENPEKTSEMQIFEKKFYFPGSLYQQAVNSNHYMKKRREIIHFQYLKDRDSSKLSQMTPGSPTSELKSLHTSASMISQPDLLSFGSRVADLKVHAASPSGRLNNIKLNPINTSKSRLSKNLSRIKSDDYLFSPSSPASLAYDNGSPLKSSENLSKQLIGDSEKSQAPSYYSLSPSKAQKKTTLALRMAERSSILYHMEQNEEERRSKSPQEEADPYVSELKSSLRSYLSHAFKKDSIEEKEISSIKLSVLNREKELKEKPVYGFAQLRKKGRKTKKFGTEAPNSMFLVGLPDNEEGNNSPNGKVKLPNLSQKASDTSQDVIEKEKIKPKRAAGMDKGKVTRTHQRFDSVLF